ncbi:MAG: hypothetical protein PVI30_10615 [Myxococcales bacterium]|jgi:hypothetical protein
MQTSTRWVGLAALVVALWGCGDSSDEDEGDGASASADTLPTDPSADTADAGGGADTTGAGGAAGSGEDSGSGGAGDTGGGDGVFCMIGTLGCGCGPSFPCGDGEGYCVDEMCVDCTPGEEGCHCDELGECATGTCTNPDPECSFNCAPSICE